MDSYESFLATKRVRHDARGMAEIPPLAHHLFDFQRHCVEFGLRTGSWGLYLDCVAGETEIETTSGARRIDDLAVSGVPIEVFSLTGDGDIVVARATAPFRKGSAALYRIETSTGLSMTATAGHRVLSPSGWIAVRDLRRGSPLLVSDASHPQSISGICPSVSRQDDLRSLQTSEGWQSDYFDDPRRCDRQLPLDEDIGRSFSPLSTDVLSPYRPWWRKDDPARKEAHSHLHQDIARPSTPDFRLLDSYVEDGRGYRVRSSDLVPSEHYSRTSALLTLADDRIGPVAAGSMVADQTDAGHPFTFLRLDTIASIHYIKWGEYFDLHVPGYENYFAHGFWSHNTGLGKTACQLEWMQCVIEGANAKPGLILTPLAVARQIEHEAHRWGYDARVIREQSEAKSGINICNYDRLDKLDVSAFGVVSLDEASILKNFTGKTSRALIDAFAGHRWKMVATATPAPNDHMELGQQCEFLSIMTGNEMLSRWFINDTGKASQEWRLKGHAVTDFWDWVASWARMAQSPDDMGFDGSAFVLPPMNVIRHRVAGTARPITGGLFADDISATEMFEVKRQTTEARADAIAALVNATRDPWVVWCDTDVESAALTARIPDAAEVKGSHAVELKEERLAAFADGSARVIVSKPSICGHGLNWQHCANMAFVGRTFSYESWYQAVRRCWRFGQTRPVTVHLAVAEGEDQIGRVIDRKAEDHAEMKAAMRAAMRRDRGATSAVKVAYDPQHLGRLPTWIRSAV